MVLARVPAFAGGPENVLVVINDASARSRTIGEYYVRQRAIPLQNICHLRVSTDETIPRTIYDTKIAAPVAAFLRAGGLTETVLYIVTTQGVPLRIAGSQGAGGEGASVDSELTLLYQQIHGRGHPLRAPIPNPFYGHEDAAFGHPQFPIYLLTRLAGYDFADVKGIIDRALVAVNRGKVVIDATNDSDHPGNKWLRAAAAKLPKDRLVFDETSTVLYDETDVIGYAGWGSNDRDRTRRFLGFHWLPGAIMTEYVSTNARTFSKPPDNWTISTWKDGDKPRWFAGSPQTMTADYIHEGVTGTSGHIDEPYLQLTPHPDHLLPAYLHGRNLAESYYLALPGLSWQNVVIGDPLCRLK